MTEYIIPILIFLGFGAVSGILLLIASKVLAVETDETEAKITEALPGANCGGCGYSGCAGYAAAVQVARRISSAYHDKLRCARRYSAQSD